MSIDYTKIEQILKYILSVASNEDGFNRELNPIHLIKYVYLVDLDYAFYNNGETYTGINWQFYHYGPWNAELYRKIEPILLSAGAKKKIFQTQYEKDSIKYFFERERLHDKLGSTMDLGVKGSIQNYVRQFGNDTSKLLSFVYNTKPMLNARPNQLLDFKVCMKGETFTKTKIPAQKLTVRQQKKMKKKVQVFRQKMKEKIEAQKKRKALLKPPEPRYDKVYFDGIGLIEEEVEFPKFKELKGKAKVNNNVWESEMRRISDND
jgi:hypothetical protein